MKRSFLMVIGLSVATAFAGAYDIEEFNAKDAGSPDKYIKAEFGGTLKTAPAEEVESLQEGRLVVRQKFEDPFGEAETSYQLYQGATGDLSSVTALEVPEGVSYGDVVKAKLYMRKGMSAEEDIEKVYFDGKSVFAPGFTTAVVIIDGTPYDLKGAAPEVSEEEEEAPAAPAVASSAGEECDEYDPDCEDEEDEDEYDVSGNMDKSNRDADERDNSARDAAYDAGENATDRFGIADEVRFWSAVGLSAFAATSAVLGILQHMEANKAQDAYDELDNIHKSILDNIKEACAEKEPLQAGACEVALRYNNDLSMPGYTMAGLEERMNTNKKTHDSYATARNIWFGVAGATLTAAIVLFVW
ncbi:MAG: hypothetical protein MJY99_12160 [Fibrobacter sp.]|uniref:hypothetical protein n=1 Tax=Fibrobacter sp. TaxID=35828 RepID=UPI00388DF35C|nr:hypothetical protein [Fibrobacter sp.]